MGLRITKIYFFLFVIGTVFVFNSCDKDDEILTFGEPKTYFKIGNSDTLEAPATLYFINGSKNVDGYKWSFPEGKVIENNLVTDNAEYEGIQPDGVLYEEPGNYTATLLTTVGSSSNSMDLNFTVLKPQPTILVRPIAIKFLEPVTFSARIYTYPGKEDDVTYSWDFGNGETSIQASPEVIYEVPGNYTITLTVNDTEETLTASRTIEVKGELAPTLYTTDAASGKLYQKKLFSAAPSELTATDLSLGLHPLGVNVYRENLVITEAGDNIKYSAWGTPADGRIIKTDLSGGGMKIITTTDEGGNAYVRDPFSSTVDDEGNVYWVNRFEGIRKLSIESENAAYPDVFIPLLAADIGESSTYGWTDGDVNFVDGEIWYSKHGTGKGLYKFSPDGTYLSKVEALSGYKIRSFAVDLENLKIYLAINIASGGLEPGLYVADIDGNNIELIDEMPDYSTEGGASEMTYVTDMEIDLENGYLYYPYRDQTDIDDSGTVVGDGSNSGVKRYKLDGSGEPEFFIRGVIPYGIGIDKEKR